MDPTARARSGGGISKAKSGAPTGRDKSTKTTKSGIHGADFQQKLLKHVGSSSVRTSRAQPSSMFCPISQDMCCIVLTNVQED